MSKFESLIEDLVTDATPALPMSRNYAWFGVACVAVLLTGVLIAALKLRHDLAALQVTGALIWKLITSLGLAVATTQLVLKAAQPHFRIHATQLVPALFFAAAFLLPGLLSWVSSGAPNPALTDYRICLLTVSALGLLQLGGLMLWLRQGAPTHARQAGFLAGIASGAWASFAYSMHCPHDELFYAATWYTLAALLLGALGRWLAPRLCKW
jgi:hypothetical protein